jgi:hypothetical protein
LLAKEKKMLKIAEQEESEIAKLCYMFVQEANFSAAPPMWH